MEGHQFPFKLKAILKSKQSQRGLRWFNGSYQQPVRLKMEAGPLRATLVGLPIRHVKSLRQSESVRKKRVQVLLQAGLEVVIAVRIIQSRQLEENANSLTGSSSDMDFF